MNVSPSAAVLLSILFPVPFPLSSFKSQEKGTREVKQEQSQAQNPKKTPKSTSPSWVRTPQKLSLKEEYKSTTPSSNITLADEPFLFLCCVKKKYILPFFFFSMYESGEKLEADTFERRSAYFAKTKELRGKKK